MLYETRETDLEDLLTMFCTQLLNHTFEATQTFTLEKTAYSICVGRENGICTIMISTELPKDSKLIDIYPVLFESNSLDPRGFFNANQIKQSSFLTYTQRIILESHSITMELLTNIVDTACARLRKIKKELGMK